MKTKIAYRLRQAGGFPPIQIELLNASEVGDLQFRIENSPFFAEEVAYGDIVQAVRSSIEGQYDFVSLVKGSPFTSLSIILLTVDMDNFLMDFFRGQQCVVEYGEFGSFRVLAVGVPPEANYSAIRRQLEVLEDRGKMSFSELAVGDAASPTTVDSQD